MENVRIDKFLANTSVLITKDFLKEIRKKINSGEKYKLKQNFCGFRKLGVILKICNKYKIDNFELEKSIVAYRTSKGRVTIRNPVLPVKVTPIFDMLIAHIIGDGHCTRIEGRVPAFVYTQYRNEIIDLFVEKIKRVFGTLEYRNYYFYKGKHVYLPSILSYILYSHYKMKPEEFLENNSRLPLKMLQHTKKHLLAVLIAFILDEGHIDSSCIVIGLHNRNLLSDINKICNKLGYSTTMTEHNRSNYLYILAEGVKKFWGDYKNLKEKYPEVSLDYKENLIENFILRKEKIWKSLGQGETKNKILILLKESEKTVQELSIILRVSRQGIKYHIKELEKNGIVKRIGKGYANSDIYKLMKYVKIPQKPRGRSRQYGVSDRSIINLLKEQNLSTKEISEKINVSRETTLHFLYDLQQQNKIKRIGKKIHKTAPSILWALKSAN